jgi:hypothetical protein
MTIVDILKLILPPEKKSVNNYNVFSIIPTFSLERIFKY